MTPQDIQELIELLYSMGETMATVAYQAALERVLVGAWTGIVFGVFMIVFAVALAIWVGNGEPDEDSLPYCDNEREPGYFVVMFFLVIGFMLLGANIPDAISPEWTAIQRVLSLLP